MPSLKQLEYFCALAKGISMSKLAEDSFVSQTAFSNAITRLEKELGVQVFNREGRKLVLNEYGRVFLQFVEPALNSIYVGQQTIGQLVEKSSASVSIAIASSTLWGDVIGGYLMKYPQYSIVQKECHIDSINQKLPNLDVDLIIAGTVDFDSPYLDNICFLQDHVRLYVPLNHPFSNRKTIHLAEAKNESFICQPKASGFSRFSNSLFEQAGFQPNIIAECDYTLRRELLRKGVGVLLASDTTLRARFFDNCVSILVDDANAIRKMSCFWLKKRPLPPPAKVFLDYLLDYYKNPDELLPR